MGLAWGGWEGNAGGVGFGGPRAGGVLAAAMKRPFSPAFGLQGPVHPRSHAGVATMPMCAPGRPGKQPAWAGRPHRLEAAREALCKVPAINPRQRAFFTQALATQGALYAPRPLTPLPTAVQGRPAAQSLQRKVPTCRQKSHSPSPRAPSSESLVSSTLLRLRLGVCGMLSGGAPARPQRSVTPTGL
jgi:hypothetical protein